MRVPSIAIVLKAFKDKNDEQMILLRVTFERKPIYKSLGIKVQKSNFKLKVNGFKHVQVGDIKHNQKNTIIKTEFEQLEKQFYDHILKAPLHLDLVKSMVNNEASASLKIKDIAQEYLDKKINKPSTLKRWMSCFKLVNDFAPGQSIYAIDKQWLNRFEDYLKQAYSHPNALLSPLKFIRAVVNYAIDRGIEIEYPFGIGKYKFPTAEKTTRNFLTQKELLKIEKYVNKCANERLQLAGRWFLFQCYSGFRYSDIALFNKSWIRENRIYFSDEKTNTPHFVPLYPELKTALNYIIETKPQNYENYKRCLDVIGMENKLNFKLTSHVGRHTFAVHYLEKGGQLFYLQSLMGHGDMRTTQVYSKITSKGLEDDMKRVRGK